MHGFNSFFGIPLTNMRDCQPGHGTVFQFYKYFPYGSLAVLLASAAALHYSGLVAVSRALVLSLLALLVALAALTAAFLAVIPFFNCVLMRDRRIVEQPFRSENLTQRMTREAVRFIER